jgi:hypothetical protein
MRLTGCVQVAVVNAMAIVLLHTVPLASQAETPDMPLLLEESFESGLSRWEFTDPGAWRIEEDGGNHVLHLYRQSEYEPPVRSPRNMALIRGLWVSDFVLEAKLKSTTRNYNHRDLCVFFGSQSPANFYYVHIALVADPHANSIFVVKDQPRVSIARERTKGTEWKDNTYHTVRIVRKVHEGSIEVYFDDLAKPIMVAEDKSFRVGRIGFGSFDDVGMFDDIKVWGKKESPIAETNREGTGR